MSFPANQVMNYFYVFILLLMAICLAVIHAIASHQQHLCHRFLLSGTIFLLCRLCPTAIKHQAEWRILWVSSRIFALFTHAFLSSFNNNYHQRAY